MESTQVCLEALNDAQGIIRAIDTKLSILLGVMVIPFTQIDDIVALLKRVLGEGNGFSTVVEIVGIVTIVLWLAALYFIWKGLVGINGKKLFSDQRDNPFYNFSKVPLLQSLFNSCGLRPNLAQRTNTMAGLFDRSGHFLHWAAQEHAKVTLIRDIKMARQKWAFGFASAAILSAAATGVISLIAVM